MAHVFVRAQAQTRLRWDVGVIAPLWCWVCVPERPQLWAQYVVVRKPQRCVIVLWCEGRVLACVWCACGRGAPCERASPAAAQGGLVQWAMVAPQAVAQPSRRRQ